MPHIPSRGVHRGLLKDIYMTSRGGLNQSLQLCTEFQTLVRIWTFVTKPVRIWSGFLPEIRIFQQNQEFPDLVYFSRKIGPNSVRILAKNPDFFNKIRSFQVPLTVSYTEPSIPSCVGGGGTKIYLFCPEYRLWITSIHSG